MEIFGVIAVVIIGLGLMCFCLDDNEPPKRKLPDYVVVADDGEDD